MCRLGVSLNAVCRNMNRYNTEAFHRRTVYLDWALPHTVVTLRCYNAVALQDGDGNYCKDNNVVVTPCIVGSTVSSCHVCVCVCVFSLMVMSLYNVSINQKGFKYLRCKPRLITQIAWLLQSMHCCHSLLLKLGELRQARRSTYAIQCEWIVSICMSHLQWQFVCDCIGDVSTTSSKSDPFLTSNCEVYSSLRKRPELIHRWAFNWIT